MKTRLHILLVATALFCLSCGNQLLAQQQVGNIRQILSDPETDQVLVVAHRAYWRSLAPENSLAAIDSAISLKMDMVELDVWKTKDNQLVLMHDPTVDRTTNGEGRIADKTLAEIKQLRLKDKDGNLTEHQVPTLKEALLLAKGKIMINLDKAYPYFDEVYPLLEETGTTDQIVMKGNAPAATVKKDFGPYLEHILYMPIVTVEGEETLQAVQEYIEQLHPVAFEIVFPADKEAVCLQVKQMLKGKSLPWFNSMWAGLSGNYTDDAALTDPDAVYGHLVQTLGGRLIQTDRPVELLKYLRKHGWHQ